MLSKQKRINFGQKSPRLSLILLIFLIFSGSWLISRDVPVVHAETINWLDVGWNNTTPESPGTQTFTNVDGSGVDLSVTYQGDFAVDNPGDPVMPGIYSIVNTAPVPPLDDALRWTNNINDNGGAPGANDGPTTIEVAFSEPVLIQQFMVGSLSTLTTRFEWVQVTAYDENDIAVVASNFTRRTYVIDDNRDYVGIQTFPDRPFIEDAGGGVYRARGASIQPTAADNDCSFDDRCGYDSAMFDYGTSPVSRIEVVQIATVNEDFNSARSGRQTSIVLEVLLFTPVNPAPPAPNTAVLGNCIYLDENNNGLQEAGEPGIPHVLVELTDSSANVSQTITDAEGCYLFNQLDGDDYTVMLPSSNFVMGGALEGLTQTETALPGSDLGNQLLPYDVTLADGEENLTADFGFNHLPDNITMNVGLGSIGDRVWVDLDEDGAQDPNELGLEGVTVNLVEPGLDGILGTGDDVVADTAVTNPTGNYRFNGRTPDAYAVVVDESTLPSGYIQTGDPDHFGTTGANDNRSTSPIVLAPGDVLLNIDFGYSPDATPLGRIGNKVWFDADASGDPEANPMSADEFGFEGVTVTLLKNESGTTVCSPEDGANPILATTETDEDGMYIFEGLPLDDGDGDYDYIVWVNDTNNVLAGLTQTYDFDFVALGSPNCSVTALDPVNTEDLDQDFSYTPLDHQTGRGVIGDLIYFDRDGDGVQGTNEPGLEGVVVTVDDGANPVITAVTDENGQYIVGNLDPTATYTVTVDGSSGVLAGMEVTEDPDTTLDGISQVDLSVNGPINLAQDFGYTTTPTEIVCLGNLVWLDPNADGFYDGDAGPDSLLGTEDDEPTLAGVTIDLYRDLDGDGLLDPGEPRFDSTVTTGTPIDNGCLLSGDLGNYLFEDIPAGDYIVDVTDKNNVLEGYWHSLGNDGETNHSQADPYALSVPAGENLTADFGYYVKTASAGNRVWLDLNEDGIQNGSETVGLANIPVTLNITYPSGDVVEVVVTTDDDGNYSFDNLLADENFNGSDPVNEPAFEISMPTLPAGFLSTPVTDALGVDDKLDSDEPAGTAVQPVQGIIDMSPAQNPLDEPDSASVDFGLIRETLPEGSIGNYIWLDENNDGAQDPGEDGIPNVTVELQDGLGNLLDTQVTDSEGGYLFDNLPAGDYIVTIDDTTLSAGLEQSTNPVNDGGDLGNQMLDYPITLGDDEENLTADFGYIWNPGDIDGNDNNGVIGDTIWLDDGDGVQEPEEMGLSGVTVNLEDSDGNVLSSVMTDDNGRYQFPDLPADGYVVIVDDSTLPAGLTPSGDPDGNDDHRTTSPIPLAPGDAYLNADFGYTPADPNSCGRIGDTVWFDADASESATVDSDEPGFAGVTVALIADANGNGIWDSGEAIIASATTDANGNYLFPCLLLDDGGGDDDADYIIWVNDTDDVLAGLRQTYDDDGIGSPNVSTAELSAGAPEDLDQDFSYTPIDQLGSDGLIGDTIWFDADGDGVQQGEEVGLEGVVVELRDGIGNGLETTVTDENGRYFFDALNPTETYTVVVANSNFDPDSVLEDMLPSSNRDVTIDNETAVDLNADGSIVLDADFGYVTDPNELACIGNLVWLDANADGAYDTADGPDGTPGTDDDETIFENVTLSLYRDLNSNGVVDSDEPLFGTAVTSNNLTPNGCFLGGDLGNYIFANIPADFYVVKVTDDNNILNGYWHSRGLDGNTDESQADPYGLDVLAGEDNLTADFGYYKEAASIGNRVWLDENENGLQDDGEDGIPDVPVTLTITYENGDVIELFVTTDDQGTYSFDNLLLDEDFNGSDSTIEPDFVISMPTLPLGFAHTPVTNFNDPIDDKIDSDEPLGTGVQPLQGITDMSPQNDPNNEPDSASVDFGLIEIPLPIGVIGNFVWLDEDSDSFQNPGESGIPNVTVILEDGAGNELATQQTDTDGGYLFNNLPAGDYMVRVDVGTLPAGLTQTDNPNNPGTDFGNQTNGYPITLGDDEENLTADFGFNYDPTDGVDGNDGNGTLGDTIWLDDGDGIQEPNEMGLPGVGVTLVDHGADGEINTADDTTQVTVTDETGNYVFTDLPAGAYTIIVDDTTLPLDLIPSGDPDNFGIPGEETDNQTTTPIPLAPGDVNLNIDFGYTPTGPIVCGQIGDTIWFDADASGDETVDTAESGIADVTVTLIQDTNGDGVRDDGEPIIATDTTDADGNYLFPCLLLDDGDGDADYLVWVNDTDTVLQGLRQTYDEDDPTTDNLSATVLDSVTTSDLAQDFSYTPLGQMNNEGIIGDTIWFNPDGNSSQDPGESGIEGVVLELLDSGNNLVETTITDENGNYSFAGLDPQESYTVVVEPTNFLLGAPLEGTLPNADRDGSPDLSTAVDLQVDGPVVMDADFGFTAQGNFAACLGDLVWLDIDANGQFDVGEEAIEGVTVDLYRDLDGDGEVDANEPRFGSQTTGPAVTNDCFGESDTGNYLFDNIPSGDYVVVVSDRDGVLTGYWQSRGTDDTSDNSQANPYSLNVGNLSANLTADFGYYKDTAALGNLVWVDEDNDGIQDSNEQPLAGASVTLTIDYPNGDTVDIVVVTGADGIYTFGNLLVDEDLNADDPTPKPTYTILVETPPGYRPTDEIENPAATDLEDSNDPTGTAVAPIQGVTDVSPEIDPNDEPASAGTDFGFVPLTLLDSAIGNTVWFDENSDGVQDPGEDGIPNVTIELQDDQGNVLETRITDTEGKYLFGNLSSGNYVVVVDESTLPTGLEQTDLARQGADLGNQASPYAISLGLGVENLTADFGYIWNADGVDDGSNNGTLGDTIWLDANSDGIQQAEEVGVPNVQLSLITAGDDNMFGTLDDELELTVFTDENGRYQFNDLPPDAYQIQVDDVNFDPNQPLEGTVQTGDPDEFGQTTTNPDNVTTTPIILAPGDTFLNGDFGYFPQGCGVIGDQVWFDLDADGNPAPIGSDFGIAGVTIALLADGGVKGSLDDADRVIATATTDANGFYSFPCLPLTDGEPDDDADYLVMVTDTENVLANLDQTFDQDTVASPNISATFLNDGAPNDLTQDFSYTPSDHSTGDGLIGDLVYFDVDGDGVQDPDESGLEGVIITLELPNGDVIFTTTDENGNFFFGGLALDETYTVTVDQSGVLSGMDNLDDPDGTNDGQSVVTLPSGTPINLDQDFGFGVDPLDASAVRNLIWMDNNGDGVFDPAEEAPIGNVTVDLYRDLNNNGQLDPNEPKMVTTTTDPALDAQFGTNGNYTFTGLPVGSYIVDVSDASGELAGYWHSLGTADTDDHSQATPYAVQVGTAESIETADFGYYVTPSALGNRVWADVDGNGIQDPGELPLEDVVLTLTIVYPDTSVVNLTVLSDLTGAYSFGNLMLDEDELGTSGNEPIYTITAVPPVDFVPTQSNIGNPLTDSDDPAGATAMPVKGGQSVGLLGDPLLEPSYASIDFGLHAPLYIGDRVYNDLNDDGVFDPLQEEGIESVLVELLDAAGNPVIDLQTGLPITALTDEEGFYQLVGVSSGDFIIRVAESNFDQLGDPLFGFISKQQAVTPDPDDVPNVDFDDNGVDNPIPANGGVESLPISMLVGDEPLTEDGEDGSVPDENSNRSVDFGFFELLTLGNSVWFDYNNDGVPQIPNGEDNMPNTEDDEYGIAGVTLSLLDQNGAPILDPLGNPITATTTADVTNGISGTYRFANLFPGFYIIHVDASNFENGNPLYGTESSTGHQNADNNADADDNGIDDAEPFLNGISSDPIEITYNGEPDGGLDTDDNDNTNLSVDFGMFRPPTAVDLVSFTAVLGTDNQAIVTWITAAEVDVFGFDLYRNSSDNFSTAAHIYNTPATGGGTGATYQFVDTLPNDGDWYYWLVPIETSAASSLPYATKLSKAVIYLPIVVNGD